MCGIIRFSWQPIFPPRQHDVHVLTWRWWQELQRADARGRNIDEYVRYLERTV